MTHTATSSPTAVSGIFHGPFTKMSPLDRNHPTSRTVPLTAALHQAVHPCWGTTSRERNKRPETLKPSYNSKRPAGSWKRKTRSSLSNKTRSGNSETDSDSTPRTANLDNHHRQIPSILNQHPNLAVQNLPGIFNQQPPLRFKDHEDFLLPSLLNLPHSHLSRFHPHIPIHSLRKRTPCPKP